MAKKKKNTHSMLIPDTFWDRFDLIVGQGKRRDLEKTFVQRPTTFRINSLKCTDAQDVLAPLIAMGFKLQRVPWYRDAWILVNKSKRELIQTDAYSNGQIYVQSLASMVPPLVLDPQPGETVLDLAAAPGGKTSEIAALMNKQGTLIANDNNDVRFSLLEHNMRLLGVADISESSSDDKEPVAAQENKSFWHFDARLEDGVSLCKAFPLHFDKILLDAPCSAEARFIQTQPQTYGYWNERKIKDVAYQQRKLLFAAWSALKVGGTLVYSTCTFAPEENEVLISRLLERHPEAQMLESGLPNLQVMRPVDSWMGKNLHPEVRKAVRLLPTKDIEGFFIAKIYKKKN